jgi:hypothetical protein
MSRKGCRPSRFWRFRNLAYCSSVRSSHIPPRPISIPCWIAWRPSRFRSQPPSWAIEDCRVHVILMSSVAGAWLAASLVQVSGLSLAVSNRSCETTLTGKKRINPAPPKRCITVTQRPPRNAAQSYPPHRTDTCLCSLCTRNQRVSSNHHHLTDYWFYSFDASLAQGPCLQL